MLSIVIPTLNAGGDLAKSIASLTAGGAGAGIGTEIVVADGGSTDATRAIAASLGARLVRCAGGRGGQLGAGARAARGDWLLFLHADTVLAPGWQDAARAFMNDPQSSRRAAVFRFALDDTAPAARRLERLVHWRCRLAALLYGDQGLLLSRAFYDRLGGYRAMRLFEDVNLVRRIGRRRLAYLEPSAITSAVRYRRAGYLARPLRNLACLSLYFAGLSPSTIERLYH
jgi:rSAM/selenodomain-associated transferase 2